MNAACRTTPLTFDADALPVEDTRAIWQARAISLLVVLGAVRLAIVSVLPLSDGETYYFMWSRFPAWSYYDHPPMIAWLSWLTSLGSHTAFAARVMPVLAAEVAGGLIYALGAKIFSPRAGFFALIIISVLPVFFVTSLVLNPEAALAPAWVLALLILWTMRDRTEAWWPLLLGGVIGAAFLCKYTGVLLVPVTVLYFASSPVARHWLRRPAFYLGGAVALLVVSPVIGWNIAHGWPSLKLHLVERVAIEEVSVWHNAVRVAIGQLGSFHPVLFPFLLAALGVTLVRGFKDERYRFLSIATWPVLLFLISAMVKVPDSESHWTMVGFIAVGIAAGGWVDGFIDHGPAWFRWYLRVGVVTAVIAFIGGYVQSSSSLIVAHLPAASYDGSKDVTTEFFGWDEVKQAIDREAAALGPNAVIASTQYSLCAHLMFALDDRPQVYCPSVRRTEFDFIDRHVPPAEAPVLFVNNDHYPDSPDALMEGRNCEPLQTVTVDRGGKAVQHYHLFACQPRSRPTELTQTAGFANE